MGRLSLTAGWGQTYSGQLTGVGLGLLIALWPTAILAEPRPSSLSPASDPAIPAASPQAPLAPAPSATSGEPSVPSVVQVSSPQTPATPANGDPKKPTASDDSNNSPVQKVEKSENSGIPKPTGAQFRTSEDGFGIGQLDPDPTSLFGPSRTPVVLPDNGNLSTVGITAYYSHFFTPRQRLLFETSVDPTDFGFDLSYAVTPQDSDGVFTGNLFFNNGRYQSTESGRRDVGLFSPRGKSPYYRHWGGGLEYTHNFDNQLWLATALNYRRSTVETGILGARVFPFDEVGNPLTLNPSGIDQYLGVTVSGLYSTLDDLQFPTQGIKLRFGAEQTIPIGDTRQRSTRFRGNWTQFIPLELLAFDEGPTTLILNAQAGTALGDLAPYDAYNLGGLNSVRGWDQGQLGTGRSFVQFTGEYRFPIGKPTIFQEEVPLRGTFFVDYGSDLDSGSTVWGQPGAVRLKPGHGWGVGAGLQAISPLGLARLEAGWTLNGAFQIYFGIGDRY